MDPDIIYALALLGVGLIALIVRYFFRSKCSDVSICYGLINIHREVDQEDQEISHNAGGIIGLGSSTPNLQRQQSA